MSKYRCHTTRLTPCQQMSKDLVMVYKCILAMKRPAKSQREGEVVAITLGLRLGGSYVLYLAPCGDCYRPEYYDAGLRT